MLGSTEVWWEVYFNDTASSLKAAYIALLRSGGNPRKLVAKLDPRNSSIHSDVVGFLTSCKDVQVFQGDRLHTLEFYGISLIFPHFSWLLQGSLPRLEHLKIKFYVHPVPPTSQKPVVVCLPTDISLRTLDLCNVVLSWSPAHLTGLRELHLRFEILWDDVPMPGDQLFRILDASPRLERLSLESIGIGDSQQLPPKHLVHLPSLASLSLANSPGVVGRILTHLDIPTISSLDVIVRVSLRDIERTLDLIFSDGHVPTRLSSDPPLFKIGPTSFNFKCYMERYTLTLHIGGCKIQFDSYSYLGTSRNAITPWFPLVPSSLTTLRVKVSGSIEQDWRDFFQAHREVRSIECSFQEGASW